MWLGRGEGHGGVAAWESDPQGRLGPRMGMESHQNGNIIPNCDDILSFFSAWDRGKDPDIAQTALE